MKRLGFLKSPFWIAGIACGFAGVAMARLGPHWVDPAWRVRVVVAGQLFAFFGLLLISVGVSRRVKQQMKATEGDS